ncbi:MAG: hypothetical protein RIR39_2032 [Pseudomonadota bacterium]
MYARSIFLFWREVVSSVIYKVSDGIANPVTLNAVKLNRSLSGVEAILSASAPLSERFILPRGT